MHITKLDVLGKEIKHKADNEYYFKEVGAAGPLLAAPVYSILGEVHESAFRSMHEVSFSSRVGYYEVNQAYITYDGCVFDDAIVSAPFFNVGDHTKVILNHFLEEELSVREINHDFVCVLYGVGWTNWGHWLVDFLPRIFVVERSGLNINDVFWVLPEDVPSYVYFFLEHIGILPERIILFNHKKEVLLAKKILMVTNLVIGMNVHPLMVDYVEWIRSKFKQFDLPQERKKVFVSRRHIDSIRIFENRDVVEEFMRSSGYEIFCPEQASVEEQIIKFSSASHLAGEYGSGLHTSIFSKANLVLTCIRTNTRSVGFLQTSLAVAAHQKMSYVFGKTVQDGHLERCNVDINDLRLALKYADIYGT